MPFAIRDGYTKTVTRPASEAIPAVTFTFRPALPQRVYEYNQEPAKDGKAQFAKVRKCLLEHLHDWDVEVVEKVAGEEVARKAEINAETLGRLPYLVLEYMLDAAFGYRADEAEADAKNSPGASV